MSTGWPKVQLGEVLAARSDSRAVDPSASYPNVGIFSFGRGLFAKPPINGNSSSATTLYRIEAGQFVYSRLFAFEGAYGIVPPDFDGHFVSNEFPTFDCKPDGICPEFLGWLFRRPNIWNEIASRAVGVGDRRRRIHPEALLRYEIPLPPIEEQRRIVARIEALAAEIDHARTLRQQATEEAEALCRSLLWHGTQAKPTAMAELVRLRPQDVVVARDIDYQFAGVYSFGRGVFKGIIKKGIEFSYKNLTRLHKDNFVYPKLMAWEGALGIVSADCEGCVVSPEFPVFEVLQDKVLPEVIDTYFRTPSIWPEISGSSSGTNVRRRRLNPSDFLCYRMPLPPRRTQYLLREVRAEVNSLHALQAETAAEIDALLPAILARAFKGELTGAD